MCARITPACAGKRQFEQLKQQAERDHPRLRGEKNCQAAERQGNIGSPPLARGKGASKLDHTHGEGITPACAGKSGRIRTVWVSAEDHPRLRGEKMSQCAPALPSSGSPPLARGKEPLFYLMFLCGRITPACAGKRSPTIKKAIHIWDHPRLRGEK